MWRIIFNIVGIAALLALIWFVGPFISIGDWTPMDTVMERAIWSGAVVALFLLVVLIRWWARRRAARRLEDNLIEDMSAGDDTERLGEKMRDALATLKSSSKRGGTAALYELPWYIIIGPPGTGKTTALVNSNLNFPHARGADGARAIAGYGGTRDCDWYFTDEAVMIDTAGRYTTQDSDAQADSASWQGFLSLLKNNRPRQPINGAIVCIAVSDIMGLPPAELAMHAAAIRTRLDELQKKLSIQFPVYVMFTKMDLVAGFTEFFGDLTPEQRAVVWGHTFQTQGKTDNTVADFPAEYDALMESLSGKLTDRLQTEVDARARTMVFGFPSQMASLKGPINDFLTKVFEPSRYQTDAALRGVYFTSGTQEGTPFDRVLGALSRSFGASGAAAAPMYSGQGKSYFINDLFKKVIFHEQGWVSTDLRHVRRKFLVKTALYVLLLAGASGAAALLVNSYFQNEQLIAATDKAVDDYKERAVKFAERNEVTGFDDLLQILPLLDRLRILPAGYQEAVSGVSPPLAASFGLSQYDEIQRSNIEAYYSGLNRYLLPRLLYRLEDRIQVAIRENKPSEVYAALKVYRMLGSEAKLDRVLVLNWMRADFAKQFEGNSDGIEGLMAHFEANLERLPTKPKPNADPDPNRVELNGDLVKQAQGALAALRIADRAYSIMKNRALNAGYEPWRPAQRGGPQANIVFETVSGNTLDSLEVPGFYTYAGFHDGVLGQMEAVVAEIASESWVIGNEAADAAGLDTQFRTIRQDVIDLYRQDFIRAWEDVLQDLKLKSVTGGGSTLPVLNALRAQTSPLRLLMRSLREETELTVAPPPPPEDEASGGGGAPKAPGKVGAVATRLAANEAAYAASGSRFSYGLYELGEASLDEDAQRRVEEGQPLLSPGKNIEAYFKPLHEFAGDAEGPAPVDVLVDRFNNIYTSMNRLVQGGLPPQLENEERIKLQGEITTLKGELPQLPPEVAKVAGAVASELQEFADKGAASSLNQLLADNVTSVCTQAIENRFPFYNTTRDVQLPDFQKVFAPNGVMDQFFQQNLVPLVDRSGQNWRWRAGSTADGRYSNASLRQFQRAWEIKEAYWRSGAFGVQFEVTPNTLSVEAQGMTLSVGGTQLVYEFGQIKPTQMRWPGDGSDAYVAVRPERAGLTNRITHSGPWAFHRLLASGATVARRDTIQATWSLSGWQVKVEISAGSALNPFTLPALREFRCPVGF